MAIIDTLKGKLKGKKSLDKVTRDELRVEKIRLDQGQAKYIQRVDSLEREKKDLLQKGMNEPAQRKQVIIARKIKELDSQGKHYDRQLQAISHQARVVNGLLMIKDELGVMAKESSSLISKLSLDDLAGYVEKATIQGEFQQERLKEVLTTLEEGRGLLGETVAAEEEDVQQIVGLFQQVRASAEADPDKAVEHGLEQVDRILSKESAVEDE
jgi:hypothetical protein